MALNATTLSSAVATTDQSIVVASATGAAPGTLVRIDDEMCYIRKDYVSGTTIPVIRGQDGTVVSAHPSAAKVVFGLASDFPAPGPGGPFNSYPSQKGRQIVSYSASGAIALPQAGTDTVVVLNGTGALAMTLAVPTAELDGVFMYVIANGKAAHTLTVASGLGNGGASFDVGTFSASLQTGCVLMAMNGFWVLVGNGIAGATAATAGPLWA